jgi:outer membrane receptor protein involved in Fe transport
MRTQEVVVGNESTVNIKMEEETIGIDEIVVIGYGTQRRSDVTGSVSTITAERLSKISTLGTGEAIQGLASGLSVDFIDGSPGKNT